METNSNSKLVSTNLFWRLFERFGAQGVTLIVSIILARLLEPEVYGTVALISVITSIFQVFIEGGFSTALIQKKGSDDLDFSTVFFFNVIICLGLYATLFFLAPLIADFYQINDLTSLVRVLGLVIVISGLKSVQTSYVSKHLQFKKFFFATLGGTIAAAFVGIYMAYKGYGVWALVVQNIVNQTIDTIILWAVVKWRPKFVFSFQRLKSLFGYGWKILLSNLLERVYTESRSLIIGKRYSATDLAYYNKANQFPNLIATNINSSIDSVLLPVMSDAQDDKAKIKNMTRRAIKTSSFILWPLMIGLAVCSAPLISLILTDKWLPAVPYMVIFCITYGFYPIHTANLNAIKALGRSDLFLVLEILKKVVGIIVILSSMWFGVFWFAIGGIVSSVASQIINSWPNKKLLNYGYAEQLVDLLPSLLLSCFMGGVVFCVNFLGFADWLTLIIQVPLGIVIYLGGAWILKLESFTYCTNLLKNFFKKESRVVQNEND